MEMENLQEKEAPTSIMDASLVTNFGDYKNGDVVKYHGDEYVITEIVSTDPYDSTKGNARISLLNEDGTYDADDYITFQNATEVTRIGNTSDGAPTAKTGYGVVDSANTTSTASTSTPTSNSETTSTNNTVGTAGVVAATSSEPTLVTNFADHKEGDIVKYQGDEYVITEIVSTDPYDSSKGNARISLLNEDGTYNSNEYITFDYATEASTVGNVLSRNAVDMSGGFISLDQLGDKSPGTQYKVSADVGNGAQNFTLQFAENGKYVLVSESGQEYDSSSVKAGTEVGVYPVNNRSFYVKSENYNTLHSASTDGYKNTRINGVNSYDHPEIHDEYMHHTHVTQTTDFTQKTYDSRDQAVSELINTNQWTSQDASIHAANSTNSGQISITNTNNLIIKDAYFPGKYESWYNSLQGSNVELSAQQLQSDVSQLQTEFESIKTQMVEWYGNSADTARDAIGCILGKFVVTMGNIENALLPAMKSVEKLIKLLKKLKEKDEDLKKLLLEKKKLEEELSQIPPTITVTKTYPLLDGSGKQQRADDGRPLYRTEEETFTNSDYTDCVKRCELKDKEIEELRKEINLLIVEIEKLYLMVTNFQKAVKQFRSIVTSEKVSSAANIVKYHDDILYEFENFAEMPVITNLSDYQLGQFVLFDDSYGTLYKVIEVFGKDGKPYLTIIAVDENGNPLPGATPITIWDQREIVPVKGNGQGTITEPDPTPRPGPGPGPDPTPGPGPGPDPTPDPTPGPDPTPDPTPGPDPTPDPTPGPDPTPDPTPGPDPTPDPTPGPDPTPDPTPPPTVPPRPIPTEPQTTTGPFVPHTGLDSVGNVSKSAGGIGALAGMALGAAGLGAVSMMSDKDKEDNKDENNNNNM